MNDERGRALGRRQFLQLALSCSAALLLGERGLAGSEAFSAGTSAKPRGHAAFEELPVGAVRPGGWLGTYLRKQAAELGSQLPHVSWPFTEPYWRDDSLRGFWWPWEQMAYWIDGATRLSLVLEDKALMRQVRETIDAALARIDGDGYLGPAAFKEPKADFHRWPHAILFRALSALSDANAAPTVVEAMTTHYLLDAADYGRSTRNVVNVESILWCYERTGDARLLALAEKAWADYLTVAADPEHGDLSKERTFASASINAHGVTYSETAKQPALLYIHTGKWEYLEFALAAQRRVFDHHMLIDGVPSTSEWYRGTTSLDCHETCDIVDHTWTWGYLMQATGEGRWGDLIERACFNAGPGAIKNDWKAVQYFSGPNQFLATLDSDHNAMAYGGRMMAYQPNPGQRTACCGGNVHRLMPNYVARMWMRTADGGLAATLYGPSKLTTTVGKEPIAIAQTTDYPFDETICLRFAMERAVAFPLSLRIPEWCDAPRLEVNGQGVALPKVEKGFVTLRRRFLPGDVVTLILPMRIKATRWPEYGVGLEHGPLVYALPIETEWAAVVEPPFSTTAYPSWNATPRSAWNYGLLDVGSARFERRAMTEDPWSHPPTALRVTARRIEGWTLKTNPQNPRQRFTPPLPEPSKRESVGGVETLTLVPYGATHLRLTIFPELAERR